MTALHDWNEKIAREAAGKERSRKETIEDERKKLPLLPQPLAARKKALPAKKPNAATEAARKSQKQLPSCSGSPVKALEAARLARLKRTKTT